MQSDSDVECTPKIVKKLPEVVTSKDGDVTRYKFLYFLIILLSNNLILDSKSKLLENQSQREDG